jgi:aryl-alcohol dehydrogenase-like predicted oxidoreductase
MESGLLTGKVNEEWIANLADTDWRKHKPDHPVASLLHPPKQDPFLKLVSALGEIAGGSGHTVGQLAVAWTLRRPEITSAIVGARRTGQIAETVKAGDWQLSEEELKAIETAHQEFTEVIG